jgi:hypothetical protein
MSFIYLITKGFEDSFTCGCDTTDPVRYHLRANKIDLSLKINIKWAPYSSIQVRYLEFDGLQKYKKKDCTANRELPQGESQFKCALCTYHHQIESPIHLSGFHVRRSISSRTSAWRWVA